MILELRNSQGLDIWGDIYYLKIPEVMAPGDSSSADLASQRAQWLRLYELTPPSELSGAH